MSAPQATVVANKLIELLLRVPAHDRARFARAQLSTASPSLVAAFDSIPRERIARSILFLAPQPHSRESRIAATARLAGWDPILITTRPPKYETDVFTQCHIYNDILLLLLASWMFPGPLVHHFVLRGDFAYLASHTKTRRLILDFYDTGSGMLTCPPGTADVERITLASANAVTHRDLRIRYLNTLHGYALPPHQLFLHDPIPEVPLPIPPPRSDTDIRVVSVGWVDDTEHSLIRIARSFCAAGIHLHIYLNPHQFAGDPAMAIYHQLAAESPYLHLEAPVYGDAYWQSLQRYDFGLSLTERFIFGEKSTHYTEDYLAGCGSSRLTDYIRAGLGVIVSPQLKFQHFWSRHFARATVTANQELLVNPLPILRECLAQRREKDLTSITCAGTARRLGKFYETVAA